MRRHALAASLVGGALAYACDSFEETGSPPPSDAGQDAVTVVPDAGDAAVDGSSACEGEPVWATTASAPEQRNVVCDGAPVDLVTNVAHCGRCNHSCGTDGCANGNCVERKDDSDPCILGGARDGAVFYARRPGGTFSGQAHHVKRFVPGVGAQVLGTLEGEANGERQIRSLAPTSEFVYVRTGTALRRTSATIPNAGLPELVATLTTEDISAIAADVDRVYVATPSLNRIDQVFFDGGSSPYISPSPFVGEMRVSGPRFIWLSQQFVYLFPGGSSVLMHQGANVDKLLESGDKVGGIAIDGDQAWVMRAAKAGAIVQIDLSTKGTEIFYQGELDNPATGIAVTVDATHVYWLAGPQGEIWKRARCGGAAVKIGKHPNAYRLAVVGDRLFVGADDGLYSFAK